MPELSFTPAAKKSTTNYDYPKLKLKNGEVARLALLQKSPTVEYVHSLRAPQIINGKPKMFTDTRRNGDEFQNYVMDFISSPICLGDFATLEESGSDPKHCPMCALAKENSDYTTAPKRRFAMHVIRYRNKPGTSVLTDPFAVEVLVWSFTDMVFGKIIDIAEEHGDLREKDLILGPCTNEKFQKADLSVGAKAEWLASEDRKALTLATFKGNQIPDLSIACGSRKEAKWINEDIQKIRDRWAEIHDNAEPTTIGGASLDDALSGLLDDAPATQTATVKASAPAVAATPVTDDLDDLLGSVAPAAAEEVPSVKPKSESVGDLDDLLADIA